MSYLEWGLEHVVDPPKPPFTDPVVSADGKVVVRRYKKEDIPDAFALVDADRKRFSRNGIGAGFSLETKYLTEIEYIDMNTDNALHLGIWNRDQVYVGHITLTRDRSYPDTGGLYYYIAEEHEGNGYMSSAVRTVAEVAFEEMGYEELKGTVFLKNPRSAQVLEAAAFQGMKTTQDFVIYSRFKQSSQT